MAGQPRSRDEAPRGGGQGSEIYRTTLLDLLQGIDEVSQSEQESLETAIRLLRGGRLKLITSARELADASLLSRARLRAMIAEMRGRV